MIMLDLLTYNRIILLVVGQPRCVSAITTLFCVVVWRNVLAKSVAPSSDGGARMINPDPPCHI
jgi:hypothetical protein